MQQRASWRRTSHHDRASSEEEEERSGRPPGKALRNQFTKLLFRPQALPPGHTLGPGRKAELHFGMWHAGRTPGKERAACVDAEISILMQHNAENK